MISVDKEKCVKCGMCIHDCMSRVIEFDNDGFPYAANPDGCIGCQHCLAICPVGALSVFGKTPKESEPIQKRNPEEILNLIKSRRSYRKYNPQALETGTIQKLKDMLKWIPSGVNNHRLQFAFIDDKKVMDDFRNQTNRLLIKGINENPERFQNFKRYKDAILKGNDVIFRGAPHMVAVFTPLDAPCSDIDPVIALSYFELYAQSMDIATCWCGLGYWVFNLFPELLKRLEIPDGYRLGYTMLFGVPGVEYKRTTQPKELKIISVK